MSALVCCLVESEDDLRSAHQDRPLDQVRLLDHEVDRLLLRLRQRPLLEDGASLADEVEEVIRRDVLLEKCAVGRVTVDVDLVDVDVVLRQKTPGVPAGGSRRFPVEDRLGHGLILPAPRA
jgi:hypothetical protein